MIFLCFKLTSVQKGYYTDDHNRKDIVDYRNQYFLPRMFEYEKRMEYYTGPDMETIVQPVLLEGEKRLY